MLSIFYKVSIDNIKLCKKYLTITNPFHLNHNSPPQAIYATTAFGFWTLSLSVSLKMWKKFFYKNCNVIDPVLVRCCLYFLEKNPAYIQISLIEIYAIVQLLKKFNGTA